MVEFQREHEPFLSEKFTNSAITKSILKWSHKPMLIYLVNICHASLPRLMTLLVKAIERRGEIDLIIITL